MCKLTNNNKLICLRKIVTKLYSFFLLRFFKFIIQLYIYSALYIVDSSTKAYIIIYFTHPAHYSRRWPWRARASGRGDPRGSEPELRSRWYHLSTWIFETALLYALVLPRGCAGPASRHRDLNTARQPRSQQPAPMWGRRENKELLLTIDNIIISHDCNEACCCERLKRPTTTP